MNFLSFRGSVAPGASQVRMNGDTFTVPSLHEGVHDGLSGKRALADDECTVRADGSHPCGAAAERTEIDQAGPLGPHEAAIDAPGAVTVAGDRPVIADGRRPGRLPRERCEVQHAVPSTPSEGVLPSVRGGAGTDNESSVVAHGCRGAIDAAAVNT